MKKVLLLISAFVGLSVQSNAQSDLTLYNFDGIAQSLSVNPALPQKTRVWIGLPALSGVQVYYNNTGFSPIDVFEKGTDVNENISNVILGLEDKNRFDLSQSVDLLGVGFNVGGGFLTLGAQQVTDYKMTYPVDLLKLVWFGNAESNYRSSNLAEFEFESLTRTNYYVGYQKNLSEKLSVGGRFKYIVGQGNAYIEKMNASVKTLDNSDLEVTTDIVIKSAGLTEFLDTNDYEFTPGKVFPDNNGFAIDFGANYQLDDHWSFSASVIDLGFINWKANTRDYVSNDTIQYAGMDANLNEDEPIGSFDEVLDSLGEAFKFKEVDGKKYTRWLTTRAFLAANYRISEKHTFGAIYHLKLWDGNATHDFGVNYQGRLSNAFHYTVSYSSINGTYSNVGLGLQTKLGPVQLYLLSDNVLDMVLYENLQTTNVRVGLNIALYSKADKNKKNKKTKSEDPSPEPINLENQ